MKYAACLLVAAFLGLLIMSVGCTDVGDVTAVPPLADGACSNPPGVNNRFVDCGNGTVTDTQTGLIWLKKANCFAPQDWASKDGQAKHTAGSGADPRYARALFECIRPQIRKAISDAIDTYLDYRRQEEKVLQTNREPDGAAIRFIVPIRPWGGWGLDYSTPSRLKSPLWPSGMP